MQTRVNGKVADCDSIRLEALARRKQSPCKPYSYFLQTRPEFDARAEAGGAISLTGRFNPVAPDGWAHAVYREAESAADALEDAVRATFGIGIMDPPD